MSIADQTIHILVQNRVHDITRIVMNLDCSQLTFAKVQVSTTSVTLEMGKAICIRMTTPSAATLKLFAYLPSRSVDARDSLLAIEQLIKSAADWLGTTPAALGVRL